MNTALVVMWVLCCFGLVLIAVYILTGFTRSYFLYLGTGFLISALIACVPESVRWVPQVLALLIFIYAVVDGVIDTRERLRLLKNEQRAREAAYSDYLLRLARNGMREVGEKWFNR